MSLLSLVFRKDLFNWSKLIILLTPIFDYCMTNLFSSNCLWSMLQSSRWRGCVKDRKEDRIMSLFWNPKTPYNVSFYESHIKPVLFLKLPDTSRQIQPTVTHAHPSWRSNRALSRPLSQAGSWAGTMTTGALTPWSGPWRSWRSELRAVALDL